MTKAMLAPLVPLLGLELGASPAVVGLLVSLAFVFPLFLAMPTGALVDRVGSRGLITAGAVGLGLAPLAVTLWPNLAVLALAQVVAGLAHLVLVVAAQSHIASLGTSGREREKNFGWYTTFLSAGQLVGPLLAGVLADTVSYELAFGVAGTVSLAAVAMSRFLPASRLGASGGPLGLYGQPGQVRSLLSNEGVKIALVVSSGVLFAMSAHAAFLPLYLESLAYPVTAIGFLISFKALMAMVVRPFMSGIIHLLGGRARTLLVMVLMVALGLGMTGFVTSVPALVMVAVLVGVGSGLSQPLSMVAVADHVEARERGFALGLRLTGNRVAQVVGPLLLGVVAEVAGFGLTFLVAGLALVGSSLLILLWGPAFEQAERALARAPVKEPS
jgi:MFS family permease